MNPTLYKTQSIVTKIFLWTSPLVLLLLLAINYPELEKEIWLMSFIAPFLALSFGLWFLSFLFVVIATFTSSQYKEDILQDVILRPDRDEREAFASAQAAKKSILITIITNLIILLCTTGQYNKSETVGKSSLTIGHFQLTDNPSYTTEEADGVITHFQLPMSKMSLVLFIIMVQLFSFHISNIIAQKRLE